MFGSQNFGGLQILIYGNWWKSEERDYLSESFIFISIERDDLMKREIILGLFY